MTEQFCRVSLFGSELADLEIWKSKELILFILKIFKSETNWFSLKNLKIKKNNFHFQFEKYIFECCNF